MWLLVVSGEGEDIVGREGGRGCGQGSSCISPRATTADVSVVLKAGSSMHPENPVGMASGALHCQARKGNKEEQTAAPQELSCATSLRDLRRFSNSGRQRIWCFLFLTTTGAEAFKLVKQGVAFRARGSR